ncbi:MAG: hypothetical protein CW335_02385, partial [Clostridiales bacterium]|nr:hypothetical protein [Clostridiales bacterium]
MRKMLSKALSVVLALCMVISVFPVMSFAVSETTLSSAELNLQSGLYPHPFSENGRAALSWPDVSGTNNVYQSYWQVEDNYDESFDNATPEAWAVNGRDASHPNAFVATNSAPCDDALGTDDPNYNLYTYSYSCMSYEFMGDATLSFDWRASCEDFAPEGYSTEDPNTCLWDSFVVAIDGVVVIQIGGETDWQHFGDYEITGEPTDSHKIAWMYTKDAGYGQHEDCAFVDNIVLTVDNSVKLTADELNLQSDLIPHPFSVAGEAMLTWDDTDDVMDTYSQSEWAREEYASYYEDYEGKTAYAWEQVNYDAAHPTALKSTNTEEDVYSTYSAMSYTFSGPTTLSFDYLLAFETCDDETNTACDTLELIVDNRVVMQKAELLNDVPAWKTFSYEITGDGEHNVIWVFNRDFFDSGTEVYDRAAYVDNITVEVSGSCDLSSAKLTYKENGVDKELTANGGNLSYAAGTVSDLCVHFDDDGETIYTLKVDGVEVTPVNGVYAIADAGQAHSINIIAMRPGFMAANWSCSTTVSYELNDIITEAPEGAVYSFSNDANYPWTAIPAPGGGAAAQSGNKGVDSSESNLTLNVTVPAGKTYYVVYRYAVSSETSFDKLFTYYDATKIGEDGISGYNSDGEPLSQVPQYLTQFALSEGTHTIKWSYGKDLSGAHGNDAAYVMDIRILETQLTGSFDLSYNSAKGTVSKDGSAVSGTVSGMAGSSYTLTETPAAGCYFVGWYSGETLLSAEATYSGTFGLAPDAIEARFDSATTTSLTVSWDSAVSGVTCSVNEGEAFALTNGVAISTQQADVITLTATVPTGVLKGFYDGNSMISSAASYTFTFGESDVVLNVKAAENNDFAPVDGYTNPENLTVQTRPGCSWALDADGTLKSTNKGAGGTVSILRIIPAASGILIYKYKTSSEANWDCLYYSGAEITNENFKSAVNYEQRENYSGTHSWTEDAVVVQAGVPIYFGYRKDSSGNSGQDTAWLKDFTLETSVDNKSITIVYPEDCGSVASSGAPVSSGTVIPIPAGTTCSLTAEAKNMAFFLGWYIGETCVSSEPGYTFKVENDVTVAARFNPNAFADVSGYTTGTGVSSVQTRPQYPWSFANGILTSGNAGINNSVSILKVVAANTGFFSFDYKTSSEANYDVLYYSVGTEITDENYTSMPNHATRGQFSGEMADWVTFTLPVEAGNVIYLGFHKDGSTESGSDCAQVRNLQISSGNVDVTPVSSDTSFGTVSGGGTGIAIGGTTTVTATPASGGQFYGWVVNGVLVSESSSYTFTVTGNVSPKAIFAAAGSYVAKKNNSAPDFYATLTEAFANAQSGDCIRLIDSVTVSEDITVPAGVTLLIPYSGSDTTGYGLGNTGNAINRPSWTQESRFLYRTLTIAEGKTLTVNGSMIVGAVQH